MCTQAVATSIIQHINEIFLKAKREKKKKEVFTEVEDWRNKFAF